ncbi:MAG: hypothetical protein HY698_19290 [Deltaproteobacteria bacterium]|nr:hypothetical protein [Deltaproteobacteria bacterium]
MYESPRLGLLGGVIVEVGGRLGVGGQAGLRLHPVSGRMRFSGTVDYMFRPYSLLGVGAEVGGCTRWKDLPPVFCVDVRGSAYFVGSDLPDGNMVAQFLAVFGAEFDVF